MTPEYSAANIGRTLSSTFYIMKRNDIPFKTRKIEETLYVEIPGHFCPDCKKFSPGVNYCAFSEEHKK